MEVVAEVLYRAPPMLKDNRSRVVWQLTFGLRVAVEVEVSMRERRREGERNGEEGRVGERNGEEGERRSSHSD